MAEQGRTPGGRRGYAGTWPPREAAQAGGFVPAGIDWPPLAETLRRWVRAEAGAGRLLPWGAVAFLLRRQKVFPVVVMIAAMAAGFAVATWKTARVAHGVLARPMFGVSFTGYVETRD